MGSQRLRPMPRLILLSFTEPTDMPHTPVMPDMPMELTHMPMVLTTERETLKLNQRLMLTMDTTDMPDLMPMVTDHMDTQLMVTTERDLLMLSQRLMPTTDTTDMPDLMPMVLMVMVLMDVSGDKLNATQLRSSKANIKYQ